MIERGAVHRLKRRLGFGSSTHAEPVAVMQASELNGALPTTIIVPLDVKMDVYDGLPTVDVSAAEAGESRDHVALPTQLRTIAIDRLEPGAVGMLRPNTIVELDEMIRIVLDL